MFLRWETARSTVYQGEGFLLRLRLYYDGNVSQPDIYPKLSVPDGWVREIKQKTAATEERINGRTYGVATLKTYWVIPQKSGRLAVPVYPVSVRMTVPPKPDDFFQVEQTVARTIAAPELAVTVTPLPEPKPSGFAGAVGVYEWQVSARDTVKVGRPLPFVFRVSGKGNLPFVTLPTAPLPDGLEGFDTKTSDDFAVTEKGVSGGRTFTQTVVPARGGSYALPFAFSFFDPARRRYVTLTDTLRLHVTDTAAATAKTTPPPVAQPTPVVSGLEWHSGPLAAQKPFFGSRWFWVLAAFPWLAVLLAWVWRNVQERRRLSPSRPYREACRALRQLEKQPETAALEKVLFGYLSARYGLAAADWHRTGVGTHLAGKVPETVVLQLQNLLDDFGRIRFGGAATTDWTAQVASVRDTIQALEAQKRKSPRLSVGQAAVVAVLAVFGEILAVTTDDYPLARRDYEQGRFAEAAQRLDALQRQGYGGAALYANLAAAYTQAGNTGRAVWAYEKARRANPDDPTVAQRLHDLRRRANLLPPSETPWLRLAWRINADYLAYGGLAFWWLGGLWFAGGLLLNWSRRRLGAWGLAMGAGLLLVAGLSVWIRRTDTVQIVVSPARAYYAPSMQAAELARLPAGTAVTKEDSFGAWDKIRLPDGRRVWTQRSTVYDLRSTN